MAGRPATADHRRKAKAQPVRIAVIRSEGAAISCSCGGFEKVHIRLKVREDAAERHVTKAHKGRAMWL